MQPSSKPRSPWLHCRSSVSTAFWPCTIVAVTTQSAMNLRHSRSTRSGIVRPGPRKKLRSSPSRAAHRFFVKVIRSFGNRSFYTAVFRTTAKHFFCSRFGIEPNLCRYDRHKAAAAAGNLSCGLLPSFAACYSVFSSLRFLLCAALRIPSRGATLRHILRPPLLRPSLAFLLRFPLPLRPSRPCFSRLLLQ